MLPTTPHWTHHFSVRGVIVGEKKSESVRHQGKKRSGQPDSNQRPKEIHNYYSPPLYQLSYARIQDERTVSVNDLKRGEEGASQKKGRSA